MALAVGGLWFSYINEAPDGNPNDGVFNVILKPNGVDFDGKHVRSASTVEHNGTYTPASGGKPDLIKFTEQDPDDPMCIFTYTGELKTVGKDIITEKGKRHRECSGLDKVGDDDWVGTHTT